MTLIITEISPFGIAMVADTALTVDSCMADGTIEGRSFNGLRKLLPLKKINGGLSYWGWTHIKPFNDIKNGIPFDWWISDIIRKNWRKFSTVDKLALILEKELRKVIPSIDENEFNEFKDGNGGIHLVAFNEGDGKFAPDFWHIHNGLSQALPDKDIDPLQVNANNDCPPPKSSNYMNNSMVYRTINGENQVFNRLVNSMNEFINKEFIEQEIVLPMPNILARAKYLKSLVQLISNLYEVSGIVLRRKEYNMIFDYPMSVGNEITILTIEEDIITNYFTAK